MQIDEHAGVEARGGVIRVHNYGSRLLLATLPELGTPCHIEPKGTVVLQPHDVAEALPTLTVVPVEKCPTCGLIDETVSTPS